MNGPTSRVLITGADGFVGRHLCPLLEKRDWTVLAGVRMAANCPGFGFARGGLVEIGNLEKQNDWAGLLAGCQAVVHLAGRVHVMDDSGEDPLAQYLAINTEATRRLAEGAAQAGVRRFVLVSTIKVCGEGDLGTRVAADGGNIWPEDLPPAPVGPYAISKARAEAELQSVCRRSGMEFTIVRPPLVYGPGVRANFLSLIRWVDKGLPMPLASITNLRSLVGLGNLASFIIRCLESPAAANQIFQVADREPLSTPALIRALALALGRPARLFHFPPSLLLAGAHVFGRLPVWRRLSGSLTVDNGKAEALLDWHQPISLAEELSLTAAWFREQTWRGEEG